MSINWWADKPNASYPFSGILLIKKTDTHNNSEKNLKIIMLREISQMTDCILYDSIYTEFLEKAKLYKQRTDHWLPGAEDGSGDVLNMQEETF